MRLTWLCAIPLTLALYSPAAAQVGPAAEQVSVTAEQVSVTTVQVNGLVEHDTSNDLCKNFKMRVLMPADVSTKPRSASPVGSPDPRLVWNPCRSDVQQFAAVPVSPTPGGGTSPTLVPFTPQSPPAGVEQPTIPGVQLQPASEMKRRHQ
jgi:hypothetical protein